jgi:hypothetical protein
MGRQGAAVIHRTMIGSFLFRSADLKVGTTSSVATSSVATSSVATSSVAASSVLR